MFCIFMRSFVTSKGGTYSTYFTTLCHTNTISMATKEKEGNPPSHKYEKKKFIDQLWRIKRT